MANNYYDATGVLVLSAVTPVIKALFGNFSLDPEGGEDGQAYIAVLSEESNPSWDDVLEGLVELSQSLALDVPSDFESLEGYLELLGRHFGAKDQEKLGDLTGEDNVDMDTHPELRVLFAIANQLDDGHGLAALQIEGAWHSQRPRLFEFGGEGLYFSRQFTCSTNSSTALTLGKAVDSALQSNDLVRAAASITKHLDSLLDGVFNPQIREQLRATLAQALAESPVLDEAHGEPDESDRPR